MRLIDALLQKTASGGVVCASFWQFMGDEKFVKKAETWNSKAKSELASVGLDASQLETGDYFLGWQNEPGLWRYCHDFEEFEIDALVAAACEGGKAREVARFSADGKSGAMNRYVVLQNARTRAVEFPFEVSCVSVGLRASMASERAGATAAYEKNGPLRAIFLRLNFGLFELCCGAAAIGLCASTKARCRQ